MYYLSVFKRFISSFNLMYCEDSGLISCNKPRPRWLYGPKKGGENIFLKLTQLHYHMWCVIVRHMWCVHLLFTSEWKFSSKSLESSLAKWIPRTRHQFSWPRVSARCILRTLVPRSTPVGGRSLGKRHLVAGQRRSGKQNFKLFKLTLKYFDFNVKIIFFRDWIDSLFYHNR